MNKEKIGEFELNDIHEGDKKDYTISHTATRHQESYVIRFDHKEFFVAVKECRKHHKDYDEMTEFEIIQIVNPYDEQKIGEIMSQILKMEVERE